MYVKCVVFYRKPICDIIGYTGENLTENANNVEKSVEKLSFLYLILLFVII